MMTDWIRATTEKAEMKAGVLKVYDDTIANGFTRDEVRAICKGGILSSDNPGVWPLIEYWLDTERPTRENK